LLRKRTTATTTKLRQKFAVQISKKSTLASKAPKRERDGRTLRTERVNNMALEAKWKNQRKQRKQRGNRTGTLTATHVRMAMTVGKAQR